MSNSAAKWAERWRTAPSLLSKTLTILELLMPPMMLIFLLYAVSFLVAASVGFNPVTLNRTEAVPSVGCVGDPLTLRLERTLAPVTLGSTTALNIWGYWESTENEVTVKELFSTDVGPVGRHVVENKLTTIMPLLPGEWRRVWEVHVEGRVLRSEPEHNFTVRSDKLLTVVERTPRTSHLCKGG